MSSATGAGGRNRPAACPWDDLDPDGRDLPLQAFPGFLISRLAGSLQRELTHGYLSPFGLTTPQWRTLGALAAQAPIYLSDLVRLSMLDKALISRTMRSLVHAGLAQMDTDPSGNRKKLLCRITPAGRALYRRVLPRARRAQAQLLTGLDFHERRALFSALNKLQASLDRIGPGAPHPAA